MNILAESIEVQNAAKELIGLGEEPRGPDSVNKVRKIFDVLSGAKNQSAIETIVNAHSHIIINYACPPL